MTFNHDGTKLASASEKGTLIRIFNVDLGLCIQELRRGVPKADIYSINFSKDGKWIACSSDKGTIHIFCTKNDVKESLEEDN